MKHFLTILLIVVSLVVNIQAQVKIGGSGSPHSNAVLELDGGTDKGLLLPRHTSAEMNAMNNVPDGMMIYNTTFGKLYIRRSGNWESTMGMTLPHDQSYTNDNNYILKLVNLSASDSYGAIMGQSSTGRGVTGWSDSGYGMIAHSNSGYGLYAHAATGTAFYAASTSGPAI